MLRQIILWITGRWAATKWENERKLRIGQRAAHIMVFYLYGVPITSINASDEAHTVCTTPPPNDADELLQFVRPLPLARLAETAMLEVADELLRGRRFLEGRLPDRSLIGFCNGNGRILASQSEINDLVIGAAENLYASIGWKRANRRSN